MVDHYEPGTGGVDVDCEMARVRELLVKYPPLADRHRDSAGRPLQRTWFIPPHYHRRGHLRNVVDLCRRGYGEIELHLHHGKTQPDTSENLEATIRLCLEEFGAFGIFGREEGRPRYGFIHGDWAVDNSRGNRFCGVNDEISILKRTGCYADFTFPSMNEANPARHNAIYYATDDPTRPKSHNWGPEAEVGRAPSGDLLLVEGPLHPLRIKPGPLGWRLRGDAVDGFPPSTVERVDQWVRAGIHVRGRRDWIVVKTHTHGAADAAAVLGPEMDLICERLETRYNDGREYVLHYVNAREIYNVVKAAEAGEAGGDPRAFFDYKVKPPTYNGDPGASEASAELQERVARTYRG
jgi:hypothetical protein